MKARAMAHESATNLAEDRIADESAQTPVYRVGKTDDPVIRLGALELEEARGYLGNPGSPARTFVVNPDNPREAREAFDRIFKSERAYERRVNLINKILPRVSLSLIVAVPASIIFQLEPMSSISVLPWLPVLAPLACFVAAFLHRRLSAKLEEKGKEFAKALKKTDAREVPTDLMEEFYRLASPSPKLMYEALGLIEEIASESRRSTRKALEKRLNEILAREDHYVDSEEER